MTQPADYSTFQVAGDRLPFDLGSVETLLFDADKPLFYALDFFDFLIRTYPGPRLMKSVAGAGAGGIIPIPVVQKYPWPPELDLPGNQFRFPLLAVYRKSSTYKRKTAGWENDRCLFDLFYALPPLTSGQNESLLPILRSVAETIRHKTTQGWDPGYTPPGGNPGDQPWGLQFAGVEEIGFERDTYGTMPGTGNLRFPFLLMEGYFVERDMYVPGQKFAGADIVGNLVASDLTTVPNFMLASSQQAPSITSVNPGGGPIAGGQTVTITGALFLPTPMVIFGNTTATNVVWNSATSITCVSPAVSGGGTLGVIVINRDGQVGTSPNSYTYS